MVRSVKREMLTEWEKLAIQSYLDFYPTVEVVRLNARMTAVKIDGKWVINETEAATI